MGLISGDAYLGLTVPDLGEWSAFATEVIGAQIADSSTDERIDFRVDHRAWRLSIEEGEVSDIAYVGWEVQNAGQLDELAAHLRASGVEVREDPELAEARGVRRLLVTHDPANVQTEFVYGAYVPKAPFVSPTGARFVTGLHSDGDMGFGHFELAFEDEEAARKFYFDILGFHPSDTVSSPGFADAIFTHVNPRHHSLAFCEWKGAPRRLSHFMFEMENLDMVNRSLDRVFDRGDVITHTLGKHTNDHMLSFYVTTPCGCLMEVGCGGRLIDDETWVVEHYSEGSYWGHRDDVLKIQPDSQSLEPSL